MNPRITIRIMLVLHMHEIFSTER